jgi:DNA-binding CsgD family transcriptional regulator
MSTSSAAPPGRENARERRRRMRREAAIIREGDALQLFAGGLTYQEIAADLRVALSTAHRLVSRGLARRAETEGPVVEQARALFLLRIEQMMHAWMPLALGKGLDADLRPRSPHEGAAKIVLGLLDRFADVNPGLRAALKLDLGDAPQTPDEAIALIAARLAAISVKERVVEGELAAAGTDLDRLASGDDKTAPPVIPERVRKST